MKKKKGGGGSHSLKAPVRHDLDSDQFAECLEEINERVFAKRLKPLMPRNLEKTLPLDKEAVVDVLQEETEMAMLRLMHRANLFAKHRTGNKSKNAKKKMELKVADIEAGWKSLLLDAAAPDEKSVSSELD